MLRRFHTMDSNILLSVVNMKLRNEFESLDELAAHYSIDKLALEEKLNQAGYRYHQEQNQFR